MGIPTFTQEYPPDGSSLGQTKAAIRDNLDGTFLTLGVDHINNNGIPGANPAGYHNLIHLVPQSGTVNPVVGFGELYARISNSIANDTAMFWKTGGGIGIQMTMNVAPSATQNGYSFLPGGILVQWGVYNAPGGNFSSGSTKSNDAGQTPITFPISFPNNLFIVTANPLVSFASLPNSQASVNIRGSDLGAGVKTTCGWQFFTNSASYTGFIWFAIGS